MFALPPFATIDDLESRMGNMSQQQQLMATAWLSDASDLIRGYTGEDWVDDEGELSGTPAQLQKMRGIAARAVIRVFRNPDGATQESAGPFSRSMAGQPGPWLTNSDKLALDRLSGPRVWTIPTTRGRVETPSRSRFEDLDELNDIA